MTHDEDDESSFTIDDLPEGMRERVKDHVTRRQHDTRAMLAEVCASMGGFTDAAQRATRHIIQRAQDRGLDLRELTQGTVVLLCLLSILRWERKVALCALERLPIDLSALAHDVDLAIGESSQAARSNDSMPHPLSVLVDEAKRQAQALGHKWVGTEHLLLAAVQLACPHAEDLLRRYGIVHGRLKQAVLEVLAG